MIPICVLSCHIHVEPQITRKNAASDAAMVLGCHQTWLGHQPQDDRTPVYYGANRSAVSMTG